MGANLRPPPIVVYCAHGARKIKPRYSTVSQWIGLNARYLRWRIADWAERQIPERRKSPNPCKAGRRKAGSPANAKDRPHRPAHADPAL